LLHDLLMIPVAWGLTYWVRFNLAYIPPEFIAEAVTMLPLVMGVMGAVLLGLWSLPQRLALRLPDGPGAHRPGGGDRHHAAVVPAVRF
jgi:hypothetical protein